MPFSNYARNKFLEHVHGKTAFAMPATVYLGMLNTMPNATDGGYVEPSGNGYNRVAVPAASWGTAANGAITNTAEIKFPASTGAGWGTVVGVGLFDSATVGAGNLLHSATITSQAVPAGITPTIPVGDADSAFS